MNITGSGSTNVAIVKKLLTRKKSWNTTLLSILKLVLRLCLCHHYPNLQVSNNDSYLIYLKILCFTVSLFIGAQPKLFSVQPKPVIGIGNWNQCPISLSVMRLRFFLFWEKNKQKFESFSYIPTSLQRKVFLNLKNKPRFQKWLKIFTTWQQIWF